MRPDADTDGGLRAIARQLLALERDVLVLSVAMFAFSLAFQMTGRSVPEYLSVLGAGAGVIGVGFFVLRGEELEPYEV